jgi:hypothetical protein
VFTEYSVHGRSIKCWVCWYFIRENEQWSWWVSAQGSRWKQTTTAHRGNSEFTEAIVNSQRQWWILRCNIEFTETIVNSRRQQWIHRGNSPEWAIFHRKKHWNLPTFQIVPCLVQRCDWTRSSATDC